MELHHLHLKGCTVSVPFWSFPGLHCVTVPCATSRSSPGGRFSNSFAKMLIRMDAHAKMLFETKIRLLERDPMRIATRCAYESLCSSEDMATAAKYRGYLNATVGRTHAG
ncbi:hypothetical protein Zmor_013922 [Zophobas morio]|uniref:Uncharacterized protein n=1 Tax=Zophobas morio TaxID=2755281 RepID=A0AA38IGV5_9CUCU|nr:hypothetical protein Zmor_013922 [Zophobas morio]